MPTYLHIPTKTLYPSVSEAEGYDGDADYLKNPDLSAVAGVPRRYWKINRGKVSEMTVAEKAAVDAADETEQKRRMTDELGDVNGLERQTLRYLLGLINVERARHGDPAVSLADAETAIQNGRGA